MTYQKVWWTEDMIHAAAWKKAHQMGASAYRKYKAEMAEDPVAGAVAAGVMAYLSVAEELRARNRTDYPQGTERSEVTEVVVTKPIAP
jgi:predicted PhzF superfamily epimerase YddE/YHI9